MRLHHWRLGLSVAVIAAGMGTLSAQQPPDEPGIEVQARGPVHEAFARPVETAPRPGPIVPKEPPRAISEIPPEQKPEGDNVEWISGYWAWDPEREDFLWVSGFWRNAPPGRRWVPGYWRVAEGGWQWVPGWWAPIQQDAVPYLPEPPVSPENGPSIPAPDDSSIYVPGCWSYRTADYAWRPGFWMAARPGWIWNPAYYSWTPGGCVYVDGYWDYPLDNRGLLFAPVCFNRPLWQNPGWSFRPWYTVRCGGLLPSLFVRPSFCHYYFGDYYASSYNRLGFYPWYTYGPRYHDPLFGYYRWQNRNDPGWYRNHHQLHLARLNGAEPRPPRTLAEQARIANDRPHRPDVEPLAPLNRNSDLRLTRLTEPQRNEHRDAARRAHEVTARRLEVEKATGKTQAARLPLPPEPRALTNPAAAKAKTAPVPAVAGAEKAPRSLDRPVQKNALPHVNEAPKVKSQVLGAEKAPRSLDRPAEKKALPPAVNAAKVKSLPAVGGSEKAARALDRPIEKRAPPPPAPVAKSPPTPVTRPNIPRTYSAPLPQAGRLRSSSPSPAFRSLPSASPAQRAPASPSLRSSPATSYSPSMRGSPPASRSSPVSPSRGSTPSRGRR